MGLHPLAARGIRRHAQVAPSDDRRRRCPISPRPRTSQGLDGQIQQIQLGTTTTTTTTSRRVPSRPLTTTMIYFPIAKNIANYALGFSPREIYGVYRKVFVQPRCSDPPRC